MASVEEGTRINLDSIQSTTKCPICLDVIRDARMVMVCLHRLCGNCIEQSLRINKLECPLCRARMSSRRDTRPDPNFDLLVSSIYGDVEGFNAEVLARTDQINKSHQDEYTKVVRGAEAQDRANKGKIPPPMAPVPTRPVKKARPDDDFGPPPGPAPAAAPAPQPIVVPQYTPEELKARASELRELSRIALRKEREIVLIELKAQDPEGLSFFVRIPGDSEVAALAKALAKPLALDDPPKISVKNCESGTYTGTDPFGFSPVDPRSSVKTVLEAQNWAAVLYYDFSYETY